MHLVFQTFGRDLCEEGDIRAGRLPRAGWEFATSQGGAEAPCGEGSDVRVHCNSSEGSSESTRISVTLSALCITKSISVNIWVYRHEAPPQSHGFTGPLSKGIPSNQRRLGIRVLALLSRSA